MGNKWKIAILLLSVILLMCASCNSSSQTDDDYGLDYSIDETEKETEPEPEYDYLIDIFADVEDWLTFSGAGNEGTVDLTIPEDYSREINGLYIKRSRYYSNVVELIYNNKELGKFNFYIYNGSDSWSGYASGFSAGDTVTVFNSQNITVLNDNLLENGFYIKETAYQFRYPDRGSYITSWEEAVEVYYVLGEIARKSYCERKDIDINSEKAANIKALSLSAIYGEIKPTEVLNSEGNRVKVAVPIMDERGSYHLVYLSNIVIDSTGKESGEFYSEEDVRAEWSNVWTYISANPSLEDSVYARATDDYEEYDWHR